MSESPSFPTTPAQIPGTVVDEVPHPHPVERVPAGAPHSRAPHSHAPVQDSPAASSSIPADSPIADSPIADSPIANTPAVASAVESLSTVEPDAVAAAAEQPVTGGSATGEAATPEAAKAPEAAAKETGRRSVGMAVNGKPVTELPPPPDAPVWPEFAPDAPGAPVTPNGAAAIDESYVPDEEFDATDLMQVNRELNRARARIFRCSQTLKRVQRALAEAQVNYDRAMRRALVTQSGGTAESRRALAEIHCEEFENRVVIGKQVVEEWRRRCNDARDDLKALENISHNVRASLDIR